jgi:agmatine deiminase
MWGDLLGAAKEQYAGVANAIAAFEPVTMVAASPADAAEARAALTGTNVEIVELPADDSWLRDNGPAFVLSEDGSRRVGVCFDFNAWGEKFTPYDSDVALTARLVEHVGDEALRVPMVLEGGSIGVDGEGLLITTEQCLLNPNRNAGLEREEIERHLRDALGVDRIVWLGDGLVEDLDTDGHVDLIAAFTRPGQVLLQQVAHDNPNFEAMNENRARLERAGIEVLPFPILPYAEVGGETVVVSHMNFYLCNGAVIVPVPGAETDGHALATIAAAYPGREVVGVRGEVIAAGGGGPHCITQQVPARRAAA